MKTRWCMPLGRIHLCYWNIEHFNMENETYLLVNRHFYPNNRLCHRYGSQLGVASCTFVRTLRLPPQRTSKVTCQQSWGGKTVATPYSLSDEP